MSSRCCNFSPKTIPFYLTPYFHRVFYYSTFCFGMTSYFWLVSMACFNKQCDNLYQMSSRYFSYFSPKNICSIPKTYSPKNLEMLGVIASTGTFERSLSFFKASNRNWDIVVVFLSIGSKFRRKLRIVGLNIGLF